jgi:hypothetical protein
MALGKYLIKTNCAKIVRQDGATTCDITKIKHLINKTAHNANPELY